MEAKFDSEAGEVESGSLTMNKVSLNTNSSIKEEKEELVVKINLSKARSKVKPWERHTKHTKKKLRAKLVSLSSFDKEIQFEPKVQPRVIIRLERVLGSANIRLNSSFFKNMGEKIEEEELEGWNKRVIVRARGEYERFRKLVIDGEYEPTPDMKDILAHPIYRVNRIMRRIKASSINRFFFGPINTPMQITEPFDEYFKTGRLFGFHKIHYLDTGTLIHPVASTQSVIESSRPPPPKPSSIVSIPNYLIDEIVSVSSEELEDEDENNEAQQRNKRIKKHRNDPVIDLRVLLGQTSLVRLAKQVFGLDIDDLDSKFSVRTSVIVKKLFEDDHKAAEDLFSYAQQVTATYQREQAKADDFTTKTHRKLFNY